MSIAVFFLFPVDGVLFMMSLQHDSHCTSSLFQAVGVVV